jgi:acyl-coenzyme A synthetase/AMP-(fatty) acid ligase
MSDHGNLSAWLFESARSDGDDQRHVLQQGERAMTCAELVDSVARLASALKDIGVARGERVAVVMRDTIEAATAILGVIHAGAIAVPLSELATADDLVDYLVHCEAAIAIVDAEHRSVVDSVRAETPKLRIVLVLNGAAPKVSEKVSAKGPVTGRGSALHKDPGKDAAEPSSSEHQLAALMAKAIPAAAVAQEAGETCLLLYSAAPNELRAVPHCQRTIAAAYGSLARTFLAITAADRVLSVGRLSTAYGLGIGLFFPLAAGAKSLLFPAQPKSESLFAAIEAFSPTLLFATPSIYGQLTHDAATSGRQRALAMLRTAVAGAEGMPEQLIPRIRSVLGTEVTVGYGLTELFQFALAGRSDDPGIRSAVCGRPLPAIEARLVDEDNDSVGVDEIGTLQLRSPSLVSGYWGQPSTLSSDGWFTTSDRFMIDSAGNYNHCGRVDDLFKVGGKWVSPVEVERALTAHEGVWECAVIGAEDENGLVKPLAFVVTNVGHDGDERMAAELKEYVKQVLAPYKYPRWIEFVDALPRGPGGKVLRYRLRAPRRRRRAETGHEAI